VLSTDERERFGAKGFAVLGPVFGADELRGMNQAAAEMLGLDGTASALPADHLMRAQGTDGHVRVALHSCHRNEVLRAHALNPLVIDAVGGLLSREPAVLTSLMFHKPPRLGEPLTPHQDLPYYPYLAPDSLITCWTALTETTQDNGCVHYLEESHRLPISHRTTGGQQALDIDPTVLSGFADTAVPLSAGECCVHHGLTVHYSGANQSPRARIGVAVLYVPADAGVTLDDFPYPLLRAGK
jgi:ectoine hydroxylase-related dioxygenase (phytanoyl-CoA dioxygenase family)